MTTTTTDRAAGVRLALIAAGWGGLAGAIAALVYLAMTATQHLIWPSDYARWYIPIVILAGGALIAVLRPYTDRGDLDTQLRDAADPRQLRRKHTAILALSAIIAYGAGGAIGPEAGLLAVVAQLSALASARIAHSHKEARLIGQSGSAAALAGLYGSPPGAAAFDDDSLAPHKAFAFLAAAIGFLAFIATLQASGHEHSDLGIPTYVHDDGQLLLAIIPALLGALLGAALGQLHTLLTGLLARAGSLRVQTLLGSAVLAALATAFPVALFSGHDQLRDIPELFAESAGWVIAGAALIKVLATAITVSSGWRGGEFFPLLYAGAAAGAWTAVWIPGLQLSTAMIAGLAAATATGLKKPLAAMLICAFLIGQPAWGPLFVGAIVATAYVRLRRPGGHDAQVAEPAQAASDTDQG